MRSSSTETKVCTESKVLFVPVVRFQTRPKWIARMIQWEPCLKLLQILTAKAITGKENNSFRGIVCAYKCLLWPFSKFNHQGLWELAGLWPWWLFFSPYQNLSLKNASADDDSRGWQGWAPNIHFPGWWRVKSVVPKLNEGGQRRFPTLPDGFWPKQGSVMESAGWWWCKKGLEEEEGQKQHPRLRWREKI